MANRRLFQFRYSFQRDIVDIFAKISFGGTGAPTLTYGKGIRSISRVSAGKYTITLQDSYNKLLMANKMFIEAAAPTSPDMFVISDSSASATPTIQVQFNAAGVATDPANGDVVMLQLSLQNASN